MCRYSSAYYCSSMLGLFAVWPMILDVALWGHHHDTRFVVMIIDVFCAAALRTRGGSLRYLRDCQVVLISRSTILQCIVVPSSGETPTMID